MGNNTQNYAEICSIDELRLQKERLRKKVEMQEELITAKSGRIKTGFQMVSSVGGLFSVVSRYTAALSLVYAAFKFYRRYRKK